MLADRHWRAAWRTHLRRLVLHRDASISPGYRQHRPESTTLYRLVATHLETFLGEAHERYERSLPGYVERELRAYLKCGIHAHGFLRARCRDCGRDLVVAFSCKRRGVCPSCNARRMAGTAAHLVDRVLPDVPLRQWVLSVPFELRMLLARTPAALSAVGRIFVEEVLRWQREQVRALSPALLGSARGGAICFPQRFGGSLNLNVHYHVVVPDGLFTREPGESATNAPRVGFLQLPLPNRGDLAAIELSVEQRVVRWLRRRRLVSAEPGEGDPEAEGTSRSSALDACLQASLGVGELANLPSPRDAASTRSEAPAPPGPPRSRRTTRRGFDVHAAVSVSAADRSGRERLLRYCARAPISLERLALLADGRVAYAIKNPRGKQTHRIMTPVQFLARLCALIPPPRHPLVRFFGVFAPHSSWRTDVVALLARPPDADDGTKCKGRAQGARNQVPNARDRSRLRARALRSTRAHSSAHRIPARSASPATRIMTLLPVSIGPRSSSASTTSTPSRAHAVGASALSPSSSTPPLPQPYSRR